MKLLLRGARVIDPSQGLDEVLDILIDEGKIASFGKALSLPSGAAGKEAGDGWQVLDLAGLIVAPGLIDIHTHLREPGFEYKETIASGTAAAAAGGFTAVACMPNTRPVNDNATVTEFILKKARACALARVYPVAAISAASEGNILAEYGDLAEAGAVAVSDDGKPVKSSALMRDALEYAASFGLKVISHCEDPYLSRGAVVNEGFAAAETGLAAAPSIAEDLLVAREIILSEYTKLPVHIAHVSTAGSVRLIREAKSRGVPVSAETAPHYFTLTDDLIRTFDTNYRVNPPLRGEGDLAAVKDGLRDGTIEVIASDHAPHGITDKEVEFQLAASGISGLETSLALSLRLVEEGIISLSELINKMSVNPARILNLPGGTLKIGAPADVTVIDLNRRWVVEPDRLFTKGKNTPFGRREMKGKAVLTILEGRITYQMGSNL